MPEIQLRLAVPSDLEPLVALETRAMHFPMGHRVREWFRGDHPSFRLEQMAVAEEEGRIVSAAALLPSPILYRGLPLRAGIWDAVATEEGWRRRGLCRALFDFLTARSNADVLFVEGATWLYRRFGYRPALGNHGGGNSGGRLARGDDFPVSALGVREAAPDDAAFLSSVRLAAARRHVVASPVEPEAWRHTLRPDRTVAGPGEAGLNRWQEVRILQRGGEDVGFFMHDPWDLALLMEVEVAPGKATWREAGAAAIRAATSFAGSGDARVVVPPGHPIFAAFPRSFARSFRGSDHAARIPDLVGFLRAVGPALEANLRGSALAGWTGEVSLSRVEDGASLRLEGGALAAVEPWEGATPGEARVRLMPGRFEGLALGYRSFGRTLAEDADCSVGDEEAEAVVGAMFPEGDSFLRPV